MGHSATTAIGNGGQTIIAAGDIPLGGTATQIATGINHSCALLDTGAVRCWGKGLEGELGYGNTNNIGDNETPASAGDVNVGGTVTQITAGGFFTCALLTTGNVRCWGQGTLGELGHAAVTSIGEGTQSITAAGDIPVGGTVTQIDSGANHTCALLDTGAVRCWGQGTDGRLGYNATAHIGDNETPSSAGDVPVGGTVIQISSGRLHTCALLDNWALRCWGANSLGEMGNNATAQIGTGGVGGSIIDNGDVPVFFP